MGFRECLQCTFDAKGYAGNVCVENNGFLEVQKITQDCRCLARILTLCKIKIIENLAFFASLQVQLSSQSSNDTTTIPFSDTIMVQYLKFAPWRPLRKDGLCLRIDIFEDDNTCKTPVIFHLDHGQLSIMSNYIQY